MLTPRFSRIALVVVAVIILLMMYIFQRFNFAAFLFAGYLPVHVNAAFIVNKTIRLVVNDTACLLLIYALFREKKYLNVSFYVFLFELAVLLPLYFYLKLSLEGNSEISSPLLSQIHRLIINPTLMIILMIGFFYQLYVKKPSA